MQIEVKDDSMNNDVFSKKIEHWKNELLDTGKRNKMINFRETKRATLKIVTPSFDDLFNEIVINDKSLTFQRPVDEDTDIRVFNLLNLMNKLSAPIDAALGDIRTEKSFDEAKQSLKHLRNKSRLALDEQGTNILYLVFGFIQWKEKNAKHDDWIKSPLVLVPVSISIESVKAPFQLKRIDDDIVVNPTLQHLFENDFGIKLPEIDHEPSLTDLNKFLTEMEKLASEKGWKIVKECQIGLMSFLKINMYNDIVKNEDMIRDNPIIRAFCGEENEVSSIKEEIEDTLQVDKKAEKMYQVVNADSSQQEAIELSKQGVSFVLQGPPGTGKSQTITNIISEGLADGKKILFVSEKMAALEVVYKRLKEVHLDDFCLPLHDYKANKKDILLQIGKNLELKKFRVSNDELTKLTHLDVLKEKLNKYAEDIHEPIMPLEVSLYDAYGILSGLEKLPHIPVQFDNIKNMTKDDLYRYSLAVSSYDKAKENLGDYWYKNPWNKTKLNILSNNQKELLNHNLTSASHMLKEVEKFKLDNEQQLLNILSISNLNKYVEFSDLLKECPDIPETWLNKDLLYEKDLLNKLYQQQINIKNNTALLLGEYSEEFLTLYAKELVDDLNDSFNDIIAIFNNANKETLLNDLHPYYEKINDIKVTLKTLVDFVVSICEKYQLDTNLSLNNMDKYIDIIRMMQKEYKYTNDYFTQDSLIRVKELKDDLTQKYGLKAELYDSITEKYSPEIVNVDKLEENLSILKSNELYINSLIDEEDQFDKLYKIDEEYHDAVYKLKNTLKNETFIELENTYNIEFPVNITMLNKYVECFDYVVSGLVVSEKWKEKETRKNAVRLLNEVVEKKTKLDVAKDKLQNKIDNFSLNINLENIESTQVSMFNELSKPIHEARLMVLASKNSDVNILLNIILDKQKEFNNNRNLISKARKNICFKSNLSNDVITEIFARATNLIDKYTPKSSWIEDRKDIKKIISNLRNQSKELMDMRSKILNEADERILEIEYQPILDRFKTEYTGIFKIFKKQYKTDCNSVKVTLKQVKKVTDQEIVDLLQKVKSYREKEKKYLGETETIKKWFDFTSCDIFFDWNLLENCYYLFEEIKELLILPEQIVDLYRDGTFSNLCSLVNKENELLHWFNSNTTAKDCLGSLYNNELTDISMVREILDRVSRSISCFLDSSDFISYLENEDYKNESLEIANLIETILANRTWFLSNKSIIKDYFEIEYKESENPWSSIHENLIKYNEVCSTFGEDSSKKLMDNSPNNKEYLVAIIDLLNEFNKIETCYEALTSRTNCSVDNHSIHDLVNNMCSRVDNIANVLSVIEFAKVLKKSDYTVNNIGSLINDFGNVNKYKDICNNLLFNQLRNIEVLGSNYNYDDPNWQTIDNQIENSERLLTTLHNCVPENLKFDLINNNSFDDGYVISVNEAFNQHKDKTLDLSYLNNYTPVELYNMLNKCSSSIKFVENKCKSVNEYTTEYKSFEKILNNLNVLYDLQKDKKNYRENILVAKEVFTTFNIDENVDLRSNIDLIDRIIRVKEYSRNENLDESILASVVGINNETKSNYVSLFNTISFHKVKILDFIDTFENKEELEKMSLLKVQKKIDSCLEQFGSLDLWIDFRDCRTKCIDLGLAQFLESAIDYDLIIAGKLDQVFQKSFYNSWIESVTNDIESVSSFVVRSHNDTVTKFNELDSFQLPVAQMRIREKLLKDMPTKSGNNARGEVSKLMHELDKRRKIMPLRKLFREIPNLLLKLKPCLMMSPLSVSYFLESQIYQFDMVIFDEASQIFPQDAIGAISRGKQVIIAGDSKQLPPTNFFKATSNKDSDYDDEEDEYDIISDSILEEASLHLPNRSLLWHYRSKNEDLITFSNKEIYNNNLITFPSNVIKSPDIGVEYVYVKNGVYRERSNIEEAKMCLSLVIEHIKKNPNRSLGIIAFSEKQQSVIEETIQRFRSKNMQYESFFNENKEEPFFVKNLENVQGDERDTIIFSICYGKDSRGTLRYNFGPLSRQGGERRLNVAITRAKYNVKLVGSLLPEEIDLRRTSTDGARILRDYINYAIHGSIVLQKSTNDNTDEFVESVAQFIEFNGYKVERHVGNSDYKVDIAIQHPSIKDKFIAGIECDGYSYVNAKTARDRDHLRSDVLKSMGWKLYRVWSTEWIRNPETEMKRLLDFIKSCLNNDNSNSGSSNTIKDKIKIEEVNQTENKVKDVLENLPFYEEGNWRNSKYRQYSDNLRRVAETAIEVISVEHPIHKELLYKRLASSFGNEKATRPIVETVDLAINKHLKNQIIFDSDFILDKSKTNIPLRKSLEGNPDRNIEYIYPKEIMIAILFVCKNYIGLDEKELATEVFRIFGFKQVGPKMRQVFNSVLKQMEKESIIEIIDEKIQVLDYSLLNTLEKSIETTSENFNHKKKYDEGNYLVGKNLPAGEYKIVANYSTIAGGVSTYKTSKKTNLERYISAKPTAYITVESGVYLEATRCHLVPIDIAPIYNGSKDRIEQGMYIVGKEIPAGEYKAFSKSSTINGGISTYQNSKDGKLDRYITVRNFAYITLKENTYVEVSNCYLIPVEKAKVYNGSKDRIEQGMYIVGKEIPAGEYKIFANEEKYSGGVSTYKNSRDSSLDRYVSVNKYAYITIEDGTYVEVNSCHLIPIQIAPLYKGNKKWIEEGMYLVGKDIFPGKYKVRVDLSSNSGSVATYKNSRRANTDKYISVDKSSTNPTYIDLSDGDYVAISRAILQHFE